MKDLKVDRAGKFFFAFDDRFTGFAASNKKNHDSDRKRKRGAETTQKTRQYPAKFYAQEQLFI
jgi:hypothetical protein